MSVSATFALMGPAGLPRPIVDKINHELNDYSKSPEGETQVGQAGVRVIGGTPEQAASWIQNEWSIWKPVICARSGTGSSTRMQRAAGPPWLQRRIDFPIVRSLKNPDATLLDGLVHGVG